MVDVAVLCIVVGGGSWGMEMAFVICGAIHFRWNSSGVVSQNDILYTLFQFPAHANFDLKLRLVAPIGLRRYLSLEGL